MIIDETEMKDFRSVLQQHGLAEDEYELSSKENPLPASRVTPITGTITVKNTKNGGGQTYKVGYATAWVADFEFDLEAGKVF